MGVPINGFTIILNNAAAGVSAGNALTTNPNGTVNVTGTVIGVGQTAQSLVSIATTTVEAKSVAVVPGAGAVLGLFGATANIDNIMTDYNSKKSPAASDVSGLVSNTFTVLASTASVAAIVIPGVAVAGVSAAALVVPLTVVAVGAGVFQLVAGSKGWTMDDLGNIVEQKLTASQFAQASSMAQQTAANPTIVGPALSSVGVTVSDDGDSFWVPQADEFGNLTGSLLMSPTRVKEVPEGAFYTFANGAHLLAQTVTFVQD